MSGFRPTGTGPTATLDSPTIVQVTFTPVAAFPVAAIPTGVSQLIVVPSSSDSGMTLSGATPDSAFNWTFFPASGSMTLGGATPTRTQVFPYRISWIGVEAASSGGSFARVSTFNVSVSHAGVAASRISSLEIEVLRTTTNAPTEVHTSWIGVEVLRALDQNTRAVLFTVC